MISIALARKSWLTFKQAPKGLLVYRNPSLSFWGEKNLNMKKEFQIKIVW